MVKMVLCYAYFTTITLLKGLTIPSVVNRDSLALLARIYNSYTLWITY